MISGIGHNSGKSLEPGRSWRTHVWAKSRRELLPVLPIEVVRRRVKRAKELGLPYRTYAGLRASNGHDLVGFLFSTNALRIFRNGDDMPEDRARRLAAIQNCGRIALVQPPVLPNSMSQPIDDAFRAPSLLKSWTDAGQILRDGLRTNRFAPDQVVLIAETGLEREWSEAARMAGVIGGDRFFSDPV